MHGICQPVVAANVTMLYVTIDNNFAILADARQEHFHLRHTGILCFIEYHKGFAVKGFSAHKRQRCCNYSSVTDTIIDRPSAESLVETVAEGIGVYGESLVHTARHKDQIFSRLYCGSRQNNAFYSP